MNFLLDDNASSINPTEKPMTEREAMSLYSMESDISKLTYALDSLNRVWAQSEQVALQLGYKPDTTQLVTLQSASGLLHPGAVESITVQGDDYTLQGAVWDFVIKAWETIKRFTKSIWDHLTKLARRLFGTVALRQRELNHLKDRIKAKRMSRINKSKTEVSEYVRQLSVAGSFPRSGTDIARHLMDMQTVADAVETAGFADQGEMIYQLLSDFDSSIEGNVKTALAAFINASRGVNSGLKLGAFKPASPEIRSRFSSSAEVEQWDINNDQSIVKVMARSNMNNTTLISAESSVVDLVNMSRLMRYSQVSVTDTFNIAPLDPNDINIDTMTIIDLERLESLCHSLLKSIDKLEVGNVVKRQSTMADRIQRKGDRIADALDKYRRDNSSPDDDKAKLWAEVSNWAQWYATSASAYRPKVVITLLEGIKAAIAIGHLCLDNYE